MMPDADAHHACEQLINDFAWHVDHGDYAAVLNLFIDEEPCFERPDREVRGRDAIRAMLDARPTDRVTRHVCTNIVLFAEAEKIIRGRCYVTLYSVEIGPFDSAGGEPSVGLLGEYHDRFLLTPSGWRIDHRKAIVIGSLRPRQEN